MRSRKSFIICAMIVTFLFGLGTGLAEEKQIDINTATVEELAKVPGMTAELAEKVVEMREENGEFVDMEELLDIDGIDNALLRSLKKYLFIDPAGACNC